MTDADAPSLGQVRARLTGRTRYRFQRRWFRAPLLVVQVEEALLVSQYPAPGVRWETSWRDAAVQDLSVRSNPKRS